ncbi:MAG TPA: SAM-dependent methyltransferase [Rickettsiales bacterium]|nr:SAM-dependent methyltransferase [Rickettsiales bacterium]
MEASETLFDFIRSEGALTVERYMELCVSHYYSSRDPFGKDGDFITAPEISQVFGELIGAWLQDMWQNESASQSIICEAGPGRGTLMKDILRVTRHSGLHECTDVMMVEASPVLREIQERTLRHAHKRIRWQDNLDNLPELPLFFVANEFFDALPIRQFVGEQERMVEYTEEGLRFTPEGEVTYEDSPLSLDIIRHIASHIARFGGAALIVDYGYTGTTHADTLQAVKNHQYISALETPGEADLTAHVDFTALRNAAMETGACVSEITGQGQFLKRLGAELRAAALCRHLNPEQQKNVLAGVERLVSPTKMGTLFKVMAITTNMERPAGF